MRIYAYQSYQETLVLGFHIGPIILMGFIPGNIRYMFFLFIWEIPPIMVHIISTTI